MMPINTMQATDSNDADLVAASLQGNRDAFRRIVERYQTLICSLAYCATGNVSQSQDMAQETFLAAWKDLAALREPDKLRAWLCRIARNRIYKCQRRAGNDPISQAAPLEEGHEVAAGQAWPCEQTISREEEAILWRALERVPETYREPLILFYREHRSIGHVAAALELSEEAVKQRLSRGRKLLQEEVQEFVEQTLERTAPGQHFCGGVLAALPVTPGSMAAAGASWGAKGAATAKTGLAGAAFLALAPFLGILAGFWAQLTLARAEATGRARRIRTLKLAAFWVGMPVFCAGGEISVHLLREAYHWPDPVFFTARALFWWLYAALLAVWMTLLYRRTMRSVDRAMKSGACAGGARPLPRSQEVLTTAGMHVAMFLWLIALMWREGDRGLAAAVTGLVAAMAAGNFAISRRRTWKGMVRQKFGYVAVCCGLMLAVINLRLDAWIAYDGGGSAGMGRGLYPVWRQTPLTERATWLQAQAVHGIYPLWLAPVLTLALVLWAAGLVWLTGRREATRTERGIR